MRFWNSPRCDRRSPESDAVRRESTRVYEALGCRPMNMVALVPARAGSRRIPGKNTKLLAGHPLIAYTIAAAQESGIFARIIVATNDPEIDHYVRGVWGSVGIESRRRTEESATDTAADIVWVKERLPLNYEQFAILRPTSPFRTAATIRRAYEQFRRSPDVDSLRAVEPAKQHPGKLWEWAGPGYPIVPVLGAMRSDGTPWHSSPTQSLPTFYWQNSSLEMAWTRTVTQLGTIAGKKVAPFFTEGYEGFTLDYPEDWERAEQLIAHGRVELPSIPVAGV